MLLTFRRSAASDDYLSLIGTSAGQLLLVSQHLRRARDIACASSSVHSASRCRLGVWLLHQHAQAFFEHVAIRQASARCWPPIPRHAELEMRKAGRGRKLRHVDAQDRISTSPILLVITHLRPYEGAQHRASRRLSVPGRFSFHTRYQRCTTHADCIEEKVMPCGRMLYRHYVVGISRRQEQPSFNARAARPSSWSASRYFTFLVTHRPTSTTRRNLSCRRQARPQKNRQASPAGSNFILPSRSYRHFKPSRSQHSITVI